MKEVKHGDILVCEVDFYKDKLNLKCDVIENNDYGDYEGIVVNEEEAKKSPCYRIDGTNLVFTKGIIGALSEEQKKKYCPVIYEKSPHSEKICVNIKDFDKLVKQIEEKLKRV